MSPLNQFNHWTFAQSRSKYKESTSEYEMGSVKRVEVNMKWNKVGVFHISHMEECMPGDITEVLKSVYQSDNNKHR